MKKETSLDLLLSKVGDMYFRRCIYTVLDFLELKEDSNILDAGCGEGFYDLVVSKLYDCNITAIDSDEAILQAAKVRLPYDQRIRFEKQNILTLGYASSSFEEIICSEVLEHIEEDQRALDELYRVLKPSGTLAITVPNNNYPFLWDPLNKILGWLSLGHFNPKNRFLGGVWSYDHKRLYSEKDLVTKLKFSGFEISEVRLLTRYTFPFTLLVLNLGKLFYTKLPVGPKVSNAMEKFNWDIDRTNGKKGIFDSLIDWLKTLILNLDQKNDQPIPPNSSAVGIAIKAVKV